MKIRSNVKDGSLNYIKITYTTNHNEKQTKSLTVKSGIKAGINFTSTVSKSSPSPNHNETLKGAKRFAKKLRLSKETIRELKSSELKMAAGGNGPTFTRHPLAC